MLPMHIYWIGGLARGRLAVVSRPSPNLALLPHLRCLRADGLDVLVSMLQKEEAARLGLAAEASVAGEVGLDFHNLPTDDFGVPTSFETAGELIGRLAAEVAAGRAIGAHCFAGRGRSPLFVASVLVHLGNEPEAAIEAVSKARGRRTPETDEQRRWVFDFAEWRRSVKSP